MPFADDETLALHPVMATGDDHLKWTKSRVRDAHARQHAAPG
jgi:hypothetical protein